jgi:hypothetical protein
MLATAANPHFPSPNTSLPLYSTLSKFTYPLFYPKFPQQPGKYLPFYSGYPFE